MARCEAARHKRPGKHNTMQQIMNSPAAVGQRVRAWQPTPAERRWEQIGWASDIRDALRLAKRANRPVFLFTHDGRLGVGRC